MSGFLSRTSGWALLVLGAAVWASPGLGASAGPSPYLYSWGRHRPETLAAFLLATAPQHDPERILTLARTYVAEAAAEGINHDLAWVQMCLETNFLRFGGQVAPEQNNFAGLGAVDGGAPGLSFATPELGVRAQIQHLKAYGGTQALRRALVNPRFGLVRRGSAPTLFDLARRWASDPEYGRKLWALLERLDALSARLAGS